jgi:hypothetical protein
MFVNKNFCFSIVLFAFIFIFIFIFSCGVGTSVIIGGDNNLSIAPAETNNFGELKVGYTKSLKFNVKNTSLGSLNINIQETESILNSNFNYTQGSYPGLNGTCGEIISFAESCIIEIEFSPSSLGVFDTLLSISYNFQSKNNLSSIAIKGKAIENTGVIFNITYNDNNATSGTVPGNQVKAQGETITLRNNTGNLCKKSHAFRAWNTKEDGSGTDYSESESYSEDKDLDLYAKFVEGEYSVGCSGPAGGFIFYDKGTHSNGWRYLEVAPEDADGTFSWMLPSSESIREAQNTDIGTGKDNTTAIISFVNDSDHSTFSAPAAEYCNNLTISGIIDYSDWFLPSRDELSKIYEIKNIVGNFTNSWYWSSSEKDEDTAFYVNFNFFFSNSGLKSANRKIRCARYF